MWRRHGIIDEILRSVHGSINRSWDWSVYTTCNEDYSALRQLYYERNIIAKHSEAIEMLSRCVIRPFVLQ